MVPFLLVPSGGPTSKPKEILAKYSAFAIFLFIAFFFFNVIYWVYWITVYGKDTCHNQIKLSDEGYFKCSVV